MIARAFVTHASERVVLFSGQYRPQTDALFPYIQTERNKTTMHLYSLRTLNMNVYGSVLTGVTNGTEEETVELAALLLTSMAAAVAVDVTVDETTAALEAKEAAILEAISSALIDEVGVVEVEVTVVETAAEEELAGVTT